MKTKLKYKNVIRTNYLSLFACLIFFVWPSSELSSKLNDSDIKGERLPSDKFYQNNLKSEWDEEPEGPGGSGEGGNGWVGAPIGDAGYSLLIVASIYALIVILKRKKSNNI